jgi:hypothetical protein
MGRVASDELRAGQVGPRRPEFGPYRGGTSILFSCTKGKWYVNIDEANRLFGTVGLLRFKKCTAVPVVSLHGYAFGGILSTHSHQYCTKY